MKRIVQRSLVRVYEQLPVPLQNVGFSAVGFIDRRRRYGGPFQTFLRDLRQQEWWDRDRIRLFQDAKVCQLIEHAYTTVPFYRARFDEHGVRPSEIRGVADLAKLPILTKGEVRENLRGLQSAGFRQRRLHITLTSGTTGTPLQISKTRDAVALQWALWWRHRARFGLDISDPFLMFGGRVPASVAAGGPAWRTDYANHRTYLPSHRISPQTLPSIIKMIQERQFQFWTGYPSAISIVCRYALDNRIAFKFPPRVVVTGSDALLPAFRNSIEAATGAVVTEQYGLAEFAGNFSRCEHGKMHLDFECGYAELLPVPDSGGRAEIILTGWANPAMPFVRYSVGDHALRSSGAPCPCGRESMWIEGIDGRTEDYVKTSDGRKIIGLNQVLEYGDGAKDIQIVQTGLDRLLIRVVRGPKYSGESESAVLSELRRRVGPEMRIQFEYVDVIQPTASGKRRAVVSLLQPTTPEERALCAAVDA